LRTYLDIRQKGTRRLKPEHLYDNTPLIRNSQSNQVKPVSTYSIYRIVHKALLQAHIIEKHDQPRYSVRPHSLRKYFRTQLGALNSIPIDTIEYWMGHTITTYNDVRMKGIDYMRNLYGSSGLSIRPKTKLSKIEKLKMFAESLGLNPDQVLSRDAITRPHRTIIDPEARAIEVLNTALKEAILTEIQGLTK
jgi:hypothetical protein